MLLHWGLWACMQAMEQVPHSPQLYGSPGHTPQWLSRPGALVPRLSSSVTLMWGTNPSLHGEKFQSFYIPPKCALLNLGSYLARLSLPLLSQCTPFTLCYGAAILLAFRSFSGEIIPHAGTDFFLFVQKKRQGQDLLRLLPWTASSWTFFNSVILSVRKLFQSIISGSHISK